MIRYWRSISNVKRLPPKNWPGPPPPPLTIGGSKTANVKFRYPLLVSTVRSNEHFGGPPMMAPTPGAVPAGIKQTWKFAAVSGRYAVELLKARLAIVGVTGNASPMLLT